MKLNYPATASESEEQQALLAREARQQHRCPELEYLYHIPNSGYRTKTGVAWLKREGVKSGVPDLCLSVARGGSYGLYLEMKAGNNKPSQAQRRRISFLLSQGYHVKVCTGWDAAREELQEYLAQPPTVYMEASRTLILQLTAHKDWRRDLMSVLIEYFDRKPPSLLCGITMTGCGRLRMIPAG